MERHRLLAAARATSMTDPLTGLLSRHAFLMLAERDRLLAERLSRKMMIVLAERAERAENAERAAAVDGVHSRDLALVEAADDLRHLAGPAALLARLSQARFGLAVLDTLAEPVEVIGARVQTAATDGKLAFGAAVFEPQQSISLDALIEQAAVDLHAKSDQATTAGAR
jgi:GGDEF domain-containing protein